MKRIVVIFAHPDDETLIAGSLAHYAYLGDQITLICTTKGEAGEISNAELASSENLGAVRESELRCSCDAIGISDLHLLGYCDSGMDGTPENKLTTAFIKADPDEVRYKLVKLLRSIKPHVVITFEPLGWYGHPDHIAAGRYATEAYFLSNEPASFPEAGPPWQPQRLYHAVFLRSQFKAVVDYVKSQGWDDSDFDLVDMDEDDPLEEQLTHIFDASSYNKVKEKSLNCHRTQFGDDHVFRMLPPEIQQSMNGKEYFIQVHPSMEPAEMTNGDLLTGIVD